MMEAIQEFKNAIKSYRYHVSKKEWCLNRLSYYDSLLNRIKSPSLAEPSGTYLSRMEIFDRQDELQKEINFHSFQIEKVDRFLNSISEDDKELIIRLYWKNEMYDKVCLDIHMASTTLKKHVNKVIENFLKKSLSPKKAVL